MKREHVVYLLFKEIAKDEYFKKKYEEEFEVEVAVYHSGKIDAFKEILKLLSVDPEHYNKSILVDVGDIIQGSEGSTILKEGKRYTVDEFYTDWPRVLVDGKTTTISNQDFDILFECNYRHFDPNRNYKTMYGWSQNHCDIDKYLKINDEVEEEMVEYFRDILPPEQCSHCFLQVGEPHNHIDGHPTFLTFAKEKEGKWFFKGFCFSGKTEHKG